jgi:hypothetical protein
MKPNEKCESVRRASLQRVLVHFEVACAAAIPIRHASGSHAAFHASLFTPNLFGPSVPGSKSRTDEPTSTPSGVRLGMTPGDSVA